MRDTTPAGPPGFQDGSSVVGRQSSVPVSPNRYRIGLPEADDRRPTT
jgi:hypothetical protein